MSLVLSIVTKTAIVFGAESQSTYGSWKATDTDKLHFIRFADGQAMVGEAGSVAKGENVVRYISERAQAFPLTPENAERLLAEAIRSVFQGVCHFNDCDAEMARNIILREELRCTVLLAFFFNESPVVFMGDLLGNVQRIKKDYASIGIGNEVADYLLRDNLPQKFGSSLAVGFAIYVLRITSRHNNYCSGPIRMRMLRLVPLNLYPPDSPMSCLATELPEDEISALEKLVGEVETEGKQERAAQLSKKLKERSDRIFWELLNPRHPTEDMPLYDGTPPNS